MKMRPPLRLRPLTLLLLALGTTGGAVGQSITLPAGDEGFLWNDAVRHEQARSSMSFVAHPLPGSLAGIDYLPFAAPVDLVGRPVATLPGGGLGNVSMIMRHNAATGPLSVGSTALIPAELVAMNLASKMPLLFQPSSSAPPGTVPKALHLHVRLASSGPPATGHAFLSMSHAEGGTIQYSITAYLELELFDGGVSVATLGPIGPLDFTTPATPWWSTAGALYMGSGLTDGAPVPVGLVIDKNDDGIGDGLTMGPTGIVTTAGWLRGALQWTTPLGLTADDFEMIVSMKKIHGDTDRDTWGDSIDNCPWTPNPDQADDDEDGMGDVCDTDRKPRCNEVVFGTSGLVDPPFVELIGAPGDSLSGFALAVIDGDGTDTGQLDMLLDLDGHFIPQDGLFVIGKAGVPNLDFALSGPWSFESGSQTLLVLEAANLGLIMPLLGSNVDPDGDGLTVLGDMCGDIVDSVGVWDGDLYDQAFDGAAFRALGPAFPLIPGAPLPTGVRPHGLLREQAIAGQPGLWRREGHVRSSPFSLIDFPATPGQPNP